MTHFNKGGMGEMKSGPNTMNMNMNGGDEVSGVSTIISDPAQVGGGGGSGGVRAGIGGFFNYMFNFDQKTKGDLLNLAQYSLIGVCPVILMLKLIKNYFPNASESKGSPEIFFECTLEILFILFCIYFIHRFICYVPTYSGVKYDGVNFTQSLLLFFVILFTIQTKLGTKLNVLIRRTTNMVEGYTSYGDAGDSSRDVGDDMHNSLEGGMIVSQPMMASSSGQVQPDTSFGPQAPAGGVSVASLVPSLQGPGLPGGGARRSGGGMGGGGGGMGGGGGGGGMGGGDFAPANDGFSSGSLSGAAW